MSRAFVDDDAADSTGDEAPELKIPIPPGSRNYLTPEGARRLADELRGLELSERPGLSAEMEKAVKSGADADARLAVADSKKLHNAGEHLLHSVDAPRLRRALARTDRRIEYLSRMASMAETVEAPEGGYDRVRFGASVLVREGPGDPVRYRIVGVDEADPERGLIGWTSPIARALMGKRPGDLVRAALPEQETVLEIVSIE